MLLCRFLRIDATAAPALDEHDLIQSGAKLPPSGAGFAPLNKQQAEGGSQSHSKEGSVEEMEEDDDEGGNPLSLSLVRHRLMLAGP